eukprot:gene4910-6873_t
MSNSKIEESMRVIVSIRPLASTTIETVSPKPSLSNVLRRGSVTSHGSSLLNVVEDAKSLKKSTSNETSVKSPAEVKRRGSTLSAALTETKSPASPSPALTSCVDIIDDKTVKLERADVTGASKSATFSFDRILPENSTNEDLYGSVADIITSSLDGYNSTIFAYGVTGAGKTYSMMGSKNDPGIIPRAISDLYSTVVKLSSEENNRKVFYIEMSYIELYNNHFVNLLKNLPPETSASIDIPDDVSDTGSVMSKTSVSTPSLATKSSSLISKPGTALPRKGSIPSPAAASVEKIEIHESNVLGVFLSGSKNLRMQVSSAEEAISIVSRANRKRATRSIKSNAHSSRGHAVLTFYIECREFANAELILSKLNLVDLAGAENTGSKVIANKDLITETQNINLAVSALGDVLSNLNSHDRQLHKTSSTKAGTSPAIHIPYKNSKITHFLKDALGGNSRTGFITFLRKEPAYYQQASTALQYAQWANGIHMTAVPVKFPLNKKWAKENDPEVERMKKILEERSKSLEQNQDAQRFSFVRGHSQFFSSSDLDVKDVNDVNELVLEDEVTSPEPQVDINSLLNQIEELKSDVANNEIRINEMVTEISEKAFEVAELSNKVDNLEHNLSDLTSERDEVKDSSIKLSIELERLQQELEKMQQAKDHTHNECNDCNEKLVKSNDLLSKQIESNKILSDENAVLNSTEKKLTDEINALLKNILELKNQIEIEHNKTNDIEKKIIELQAEYNKTNDKLQVTTSELSNINELYAQSNETIKNNQKKVDELTNNIHLITNEKNEKIKECDELKVKLELSEKKSQELANNLHENEDKMNGIQSQLSLLLQEKEELLKEIQKQTLHNNDLEQKLNQANQSINELNNTNNLQTIKCNNYENEVEKLQNELKDLNNKIQELLYSNEKLSENQMKLNHDLLKLQESKQVLEQEYNQLIASDLLVKKELSETKEQLQKTLKEWVEMDIAKTVLDQQNNSLNAQILVYKRELDDMKHEKGSNSHEVSELRDELLALKLINEQTNQSKNEIESKLIIINELYEKEKEMNNQTNNNIILLQNKIEIIDVNYDNIKNEYELLQTKNNELEIIYNKTNMDLKQRQAQIEDYKLNEKDLIDNNKTLKNDIFLLNQELLLLKQSNESFKIESINKLDEISSLKTKNNDMIDRIHDLEVNHSNLTIEINKLNKLLETNNSSKIDSVQEVVALQEKLAITKIDLSEKNNALDEILVKNHEYLNNSKILNNTVNELMNKNNQLLLEMQQIKDKSNENEIIIEQKNNIIIKLETNQQNTDKKSTENEVILQNTIKQLNELNEKYNVVEKELLSYKELLNKQSNDTQTELLNSNHKNNILQQEFDKVNKSLLLLQEEHSILLKTKENNDYNYLLKINELELLLKTNSNDLTNKNNILNEKLSEIIIISESRLAEIEKLNLEKISKSSNYEIEIQKLSIKEKEMNHHSELLKQEIINLKNNNNDLENQYNHDKHNLLLQINDLKILLQTLEKNIEENKSNNNKNEAQENKNEYYETLLLQKSNEIIVLNNDLQILQKKCNEINHMFDNMALENKSLDEQLRSKQNEMDLLLQKQQELNKLINELQINNNHFMNENKTLSQSIIDERGLSETRRNEIENLHLKILLLTQEIEKNNSNNNNQKEFEKENNELLKKNELLLQEKNELQSKIMKLTNDIHLLTDHSESDSKLAQSKYDSLQQMMTLKSTENDHLQVQMDELKKLLQNLPLMTEQVTLLTNQLQSRDAEYKQLTSQLIEVQNENKVLIIDNRAVKDELTKVLSDRRDNERIANASVFSSHEDHDDERISSTGLSKALLDPSNTKSTQLEPLPKKKLLCCWCCYC